MKAPLYWIDAFSSRPFGGNPAAVVPLDFWPADDVLQNIAFENGLSETAFLVRKGPAHYHLRWFTPTTEIDLCGHATLASGAVAFNQLGEAGDLIDFDTKSGRLQVRKLSGGRFELDFPTRAPSVQDNPPEFGAALGLPPSRVLKNLNNWFCVFESAAQVAGLKPDIPALKRIAPGRVIVTAPGSEGCDFVSRFFAPGVGVDEDPVTGSSHCALIPYWSERLGKTELFARQLSARGGELWCTACGDRIRMAGQAVLYLKGELTLP